MDSGEWLFRQFFNGAWGPELKHGAILGPNELAGWHESKAKAIGQVKATIVWNRGTCYRDDDRWRCGKEVVWEFLERTRINSGPVTHHDTSIGAQTMITVILCTYNRARNLSVALESIALSILPGSTDWEVLVIDNRSTDQTPVVVDDICRRYPGRFKYIFEPQPGKSYALNTGIQAARGEILAFTDDDVTVEPTWLQNLTSSLTKGDYVGAAGRTLPEITFSAPRWLGREDRFALGPLGMFDLGCEACELTEPPIGNNMAYRREVFQKYGDFRTELGPPPSEFKSEDVELGLRLLSAGEHLRYEPNGVVYHAVPARRIQKGHFLAWWFDKGRTDIRVAGIPSDIRWFLAGVPIVYFRRLAVWTCKWMLGTTQSRRFFCKRQIWWLAGAVLQCFRQSHAKRPAKVVERTVRS